MSHDYSSVKMQTRFDNEEVFPLKFLDYHIIVFGLTHTASTIMVFQLDNSNQSY